MTATHLQGRAQTLQDLFLQLVRSLSDHNVPTPKLDARILICQKAGITHEVFAAHPEVTLNEGVVRDIMHAAKRRCTREPVSRIIGEREFWGLEFTLGASSLDPRPDTETLVQAAINAAAGHNSAKPLAILDIGTGSGCVLVALLHELRAAHGVGIDRNLETLKIARVNAHRHHLGGRASFVCTSWLDGLSGEFDIVVSNPPYIRSEEISLLEPEVALFDPPDALDGGHDGLDAYRWIIPRLTQILKPGGWALFEIGEKQAPDVCALFQPEGGGNEFDELHRMPDLAGHIRCIAARRSSCY